MDKIEGPSHCLTFLGIILDTEKMQARLPDDKLIWIKKQLSNWLHQQKATEREILSLVGLLQHASKVVKPGRTFVARMYTTAAKVKKMRYFSHLNKSKSSGQTSIGGTSSSTAGMESVSFTRPILPSSTMYTQMHLAHGDLELSLPTTGCKNHGH